MTNDELNQIKKNDKSLYESIILLKDRALKAGFTVIINKIIKNNPKGEQ